MHATASFCADGAASLFLLEEAYGGVDGYGHWNKIMHVLTIDYREKYSRRELRRREELHYDSTLAGHISSICVD
jgi:hypothetical protein